MLTNNPVPIKLTAILVVVNFKHVPDFDDEVAEAIALAESAGYTLLEKMVVNRPKPDPTLFIGSGKLEEIQTLCNQLLPHDLIINHNISPVQERNLDRGLAGKVRVIDRTQLILDIFAKRVKSTEGILQIQLAQQSYIATRLVRRWTHLERQRGGIGLRSGSGEKQIELDKRAISDKVAVLKKRLAAIVKQRDTQRKLRLKNGVTTVAVVGYTNAGKSTLFNALTKSKVYAENRLFATLQTTSRRMFVDQEREIIVSDTVGFIRELPTKLIAAFRATLEETIYANLLLHIVDVANFARERQIEDVNSVLQEIHADKIPQLLVYNKIDLLDNFEPKIKYNQAYEPIAVYLSAEKNQGLDLLRQAILEKLEFMANRDATHLQDLVYEPWKN